MKRKRGVILIVTTWILAILTLFAIGIGFRTGLEIKLTGYNLDRIKALYVAKAGIKSAIAQKWMEYISGRSLGADAFNETASNDKDLFKDVELGNGRFSLNYTPGELDRSDREIILYGLEDESSRINVNVDKTMPVLRNLLMNSGLELEKADEIVAAIEDWRDADDLSKSAGDNSQGTEDAYYQTLTVPYRTSGREFVALEELLLLRGISDDIYNDLLLPYVTIYGEGSININTAHIKVLDALFGIGYPGLAAKIVEYRQGFDGKIGSTDDRWFIMGSPIIEGGKRGLIEVKDLNDQNWYGNIFGIDEREYARLRELITEKALLCTASDIYRATASASVGKIKKVVSTVVQFNAPGALESSGFADELPAPDVKYLFWHEAR